MTLIKFLIATSLLILAGQRANAEALFVACYGPHSQLQLSFDPAEAAFTYVYENGGLLENFQAQPAADWQKASSYVTVEHTATYAKLVAHVTGGDLETPLIDTHAEVYLDKEADSGTYVLRSATLFHGTEYATLQEFIGQDCYVQ